MTIRLKSAALAFIVKNLATIVSDAGWQVSLLQYSLEIFSQPLLPGPTGWSSPPHGPNHPVDGQHALLLLLPLHITRPQEEKKGTERLQRGTPVRYAQFR